MNSCHKVVQLIKKYYLDCAKQFIGKVQNCVSWHNIESKARSSRFVKRKIETGAVGDTKKRISDVFRGLEKTLALVCYI